MTLTIAPSEAVNGIARGGVREAGQVLASARDARLAAEAAEVQVLVDVIDWGILNPPLLGRDAACGTVTPWAGKRAQRVPLAADDVPEIDQGAVAELGLALGVATGTARALISDALELAYRLPSVWSRVLAGEVKAWRARRIAQATKPLPRLAAEYVDHGIAPLAHRVHLPGLDHLISLAVAKFDPAAVLRAEQERLEERHVFVGLEQTTLAGMVTIHGELDLPDALDLEAALTTAAAQRAAWGSTEPENIRRARALGDIARTHLAWSYRTEPPHTHAPGRTLATGPGASTRGPRTPSTNDGGPFHATAPHAAPSGTGPGAGACLGNSLHRPPGAAVPDTGPPGSSPAGIDSFDRATATSHSTRLPRAALPGSSAPGRATGTTGGTGEAGPRYLGASPPETANVCPPGTPPPSTSPPDAWHQPVRPLTGGTRVTTEAVYQDVRGMPSWPPQPQGIPEAGPRWLVPPKRQVVLYVHLTDTTIAEDLVRLTAARRSNMPKEATRTPSPRETAWGRIENTRAAVTAETIRSWCGDPHTTLSVRPVLNLADNLHADAYEIPDRIKEQVRLRDGTCRFPGCQAPGLTCQDDHIRAYDHDSPAAGGATESSNLALLCQHHHNLKTHHGFSYTVLPNGSVWWRTPTGQRIRRDRDNTDTYNPADPPEGR